ncbi:hypothetical protein [Nonomuraea sp. NPDC048826]|uniref:hypothetical protein n=1 Tax=Nonomuraea sp. NPDC048826 TaxID=3364347 RepID=UPI00371B6B7B
MSSAPVTADGLVRFHRLAVRPDDDAPDTVVVGRPELGEFVELPSVYGETIRLLDEGLPVAAVQARIAAEHLVELDVAELVDALAELGFVASVDGRELDDPADDAPRAHFSRLTRRHVGWIFGRTMKIVWLAIVAAALITLVVRPGLFPRAEHFFWGDYVGLVVLVNTAMFSVSISVHELMHLAAARSLGAPARIGFGTRLHNLVVQTDVTAVWGVPRRSRYRVYLAGMAWDVLFVAVLVLLVAHVPLPGPATALLQALALTVVLSMPFQIQVHMRTDLYYVLRDLLRCRNLFHDGLAYARYLLARSTAALRRRRGPAEDPTAGLAPHERRATRIYTVFLVLGGTVTLTSFALYGAPILIGALARALAAIGAGLDGGSPLMAVDAALLILVEGGIQVLFVVTFIRGRRWLRRSAP